MSQIKVELIVPFIKATHTVFKSMLGTEVRRKDVYIKKGYRMFGEVSGIIGLSGDTTGTCAISLPGPLAIRLVEKLMGEEIEHNFNNVVVRDGVGEFVNMIAGRAKSTLANSQYHFDITLPTLISGKDHEIFHRQGTDCVVVLFETADNTAFTLDLCVGDAKQ